jgi:exonuclease III
MSEQKFTVLSWNVRGLNSPARREAVRGMVQAAQPMIVCQQETKLQQITSQTKSETLGPLLDGFQYLPACGTTGGILLGWNSEWVHAWDLSLTNFTMSMKIKLKWLNSSFLLTTVYGPADDNEKANFLDELTSIKPTSPLPWLVLRDFNLIYEAKDKNNQNLNRRLMATFRNMLNTCELLEIALQNRKYTWSNEREEPTLGCLDRVFYVGVDLQVSLIKVTKFTSPCSDRGQSLNQRVVGPTASTYIMGT